MSFDLDAYAARIRLPLVPAQDAEGLTVVQRAHRLAIPFENLDVLLGRGVSLDPDDVFAKLVTGNRGGFCFEQNQLLDRALAAFGFTARPLLARVWLFAGDEVPPRTHTLLLVDLDGDQWIADAGFGGGYAPPMRLADQEEAQGHDGVSHRLVADPDHGWMLYRRGPAGDWQPQYSFTTERTFDSDLALSSHWAATAPESRFTHGSTVSIALPTGYAALAGRSYRRITASETVESELTSPRALRLRLSMMFGLDVTAEEAERLYG